MSFKNKLSILSMSGILIFGSSAIIAEEYKVTFDGVEKPFSVVGGSEGGKGDSDEPWESPVGSPALHSNGVTVTCLGMTDGEEFDLNGTTYTVVYSGGDAVLHGSYACTSNVVNMAFVFYDSGFNQDISSWDVSSVTNMNRMFESASFNKDISSWDVSAVTDMSDMFNDSSFNQNISSWDVSAVTNMSGMFNYSSFNQDISNWDVSAVTDMAYMFYDSSFNQEICNWDVSSVASMGDFITDSSLQIENAPKFSSEPTWGSNCP